MSDIAVKGRVTSDGRIEAVAPKGIPEGEVELIIRVADSKGDTADMIRLIKDRAAQDLGRILDEIDRLEFPRRTDEEIESAIAAERASWGD